MKNSRTPADRRGYTLMEMVAASVGASALIAGMVSSLFLTLRATDASATPTPAQIAGDEALTEMLADLELALAFSENTDHAITFAVPDRDGDFLSETIRYAWSGTPGDPLTRQYNGGTAANLVENAYVFEHDLPATPPNLLSNADMEAGTTGWEVILGDLLSSSSTVFQSGSRSIHGQALTFLDETCVRQNVASQLTNGELYEISAWVRKGVSGSPYGVRLQLHVNSLGSGDQVFPTGQFNVNNSEFLLLKGTVKPQWSGALLSAYWEATGVSHIQDLYVDDAVLRSKSNPHQNVNVSLQVGKDSRARVESGVRLQNAPL